MSEGHRPGDPVPLELRLVLEPDPSADAEETEHLAHALRSELRQLDVHDVSTVAAGAPPPGSKGVDVALVAEWLVTMSASGGLLSTVVATVNDWLSRRTVPHKVTLTIDGDTVELSSATPEEQRELVQAFVRRHGAS